ncbi:MAG: TIGR04255 family protein [Verrucomicrobiota bacterium]
MATPRHLNRAPITEAVIDLRCRVDSTFDVNAFRGLEADIGYPIVKPIQLFEFTMRQEPGKEPENTQVNHGLIGWRFTSADGKQVAQFRKDGFTFSRLAPYANWDEVFAEASRLYLLYLAAARPEEVTRPAVRYVNRMLLPETEVGDFSPFLTAPPACPVDCPVVLNGFLTQVQVHDPLTGISATITQTIQSGGDSPGFVPVVLDLDVYETRSFPPDSKTILARFDALRVTKNRYFFNSITEKTAALFE